MTSILGIDLSSNQLNGCLLVGDEPPKLRSEKLGNPRDPLIERLRCVARALDEIMCMSQWEPDWLVLEDCFGRNRNADRALNRTVGAIVASCPSETQIAIVSSGDWRKALGAKNTKAAGHEAVLDWWHAQPTGSEADEFAYMDADEHDLDAIGVALAWRRILASQATPEKAS